MNHYPTLGNLIAGIRKQQGRKQVELSSKLNYPYNVLSKWENNQSKPSRDEWEFLCQELGAELVAQATDTMLKKGIADYDKDKEPESRISRIEDGVVKRLRHLRASAGFTSRYVAEYLAIHASQYTRIEQGASNPTYGQLRGLVKLYNTSYNYLLDGIPD